MEGKHESKNESKTFFLVFLLTHERFLNPWAAKDVCLRFPSIIWFLQFLSHFLFLTEAKNIFIWFYIKST